MLDNLFTRVICLMLFGSFSFPGIAQNQVNYEPSDENFANPERGYYTQITAYSNNTQGWNAYQPIDANYLAVLKGQQQRLVLRLYYMPEFVNLPLNNEFLDLIEEDMEILRSNGFKGIFRFAYSVESFDDTNVDTLDAPLDIVLQHIDQLTPILQANKDVIAVLQAGFIGAYGEWATINNVVPDFMNGDGIRNMTNRKLVLEALLAALPEDRMVQLRTPYYKYAFYYWDGWTDEEELFVDPGAICPLTEPSPLNINGAFNGEDIYRVGQHNDCFLASSTDFGTYCDEMISESDWLVNETRYMSMGGETCFPNVPRSNCSSNGGAADTELELYHWSYLNSGYHPEVLQSWEDQGCGGEIAKKLGYRIELISGTFTNEVVQGCPINIELELRNTGYAGMYNPRSVEFILENELNGELFVANTNEDPRFWFPESEIGNINLSSTLSIPEDFDPGNYKLYLNLPDPEPSLYGNPNYSVQLANLNVWDTARGFNDLGHTLTVTEGVCPAPWIANEFIAYGCNAGDAVASETEACCGDTIQIDAIQSSYFGEHTIGWALSDSPVTNQSELNQATILNETGKHIQFETFCPEQESTTLFLTPFLAVNDYTYEFVFEDTLQYYWGSTQSISLDLTAAQIPYDVNYGNLIETDIVNLSPFFDQNGGLSNFFVIPGIGVNHEVFNTPTLPPGQITLSCSWINNPNTTYNVTVQDATSNIGGQFLVRHSVFVPFPTVDDQCISFGEAVAINVGPGSCCQGDYNGDQVINIADLLTFLGNFGCTDLCEADLDGDDTVSSSDLLLFLSLIGESCN